MEVTTALAAEMLVLAKVADDDAAAREVLDELLASGAVRERWVRNVELQGGDPSFLDEPDRLGVAPHRVDVTASLSGSVVDIEPREIGVVACELGGGRRQPDDDIDPLVGVVLHRVLGDAVRAGDVLAEVHARSAAAAATAAARVAGAYAIEDGSIASRSRIIGRYEARAR